MSRICGDYLESRCLTRRRRPSRSRRAARVTSSLTLSLFPTDWIRVQSIDAQIERSRSAPTFRRLLRKKCAGDIVGGVLSVSPRLDPPPPPPPRASRDDSERQLAIDDDDDENVTEGKKKNEFCIEFPHKFF